MRTRPFVILCLSLLAAAIPAAAGAASPSSRASPSLPATTSDTPIRVTPRRGRTHTKFTLRFTIPTTTGRFEDLTRSDTVIVSGPSRAGCIGQDDVPLRAATAGTRFKVALDPTRLNGHWCSGMFHGRLQEEQSSICNPGPPAAIMCPEFVIAPMTLGRFTFRVAKPHR